MARKTWRPYRAVYRGQVFDMSAELFHEAVRARWIEVSSTDKRKAYVHAEYTMYKDPYTKQVRFEKRVKPEYDPFAADLRSSWYLIEREAIYKV